MNIGAKGIDSIRPGLSPAQPQTKTDGADFKRALEQAAQGPQAASPKAATETLKFSNHAVERMRSRGISFQPETMRNIENAIVKAAAKGAKDTLVLAGDNALVVSVKNNTVVTVMDRATMKNNVFTNIDSTVVV
jgi:flagellar operon protein